MRYYVEHGDHEHVAVMKTTDDNGWGFSTKGRAITAYVGEQRTYRADALSKINRMLNRVQYTNARINSAENLRE